MRERAEVDAAPPGDAASALIERGNALVQQGLLTSGNSSGALPVAGFVRMFLTEPVETGSQSNIYAEFNGLVEPGRDAGVVRDLVQLYR